MINNTNQQSSEDVYKELASINKVIVTINKGGMVGADLLPTTTPGTALSKEKILEIVEERLSNSFLLNEGDSQIVGLLQLNTKRLFKNYTDSDVIDLKIEEIFKKALDGVYKLVEKIQYNVNKNKEKDLQSLNELLGMDAQKLYKNTKLLTDAFYLLQNIAAEKRCVIRFRDMVSHTVEVSEMRNSMIESGCEVTFGETFSIHIKDEVFEKAPAKIVLIDFELIDIEENITAFGMNKKTSVKFDKVIRKLLRAKQQMPDVQAIQVILSLVDHVDYTLRRNESHRRYQADLDYIGSIAGSLDAKIGRETIDIDESWDSMIGEEIGASHFMDFYKPIIGVHTGFGQYLNNAHANSRKKLAILLGRTNEIVDQYKLQFQGKVDLYGALYNKVKEAIELRNQDKSIKKAMFGKCRLSMSFKHPFTMVCEGDIPDPDTFAKRDELEQVAPFQTRIMTVMEKMRLEEENIALRKEKEKINEQNNNNLIALEKKFSKLAVEDEVPTVLEKSTPVVEITTISTDTPPEVEVTMEPAIKYASRVRRWFSKNVMNIFATDPTYAGKNFSAHAKDQIISNHNFGLEIDKYVKQYGLKTKYEKQKNTSSEQFSLAGEIERNGNIQRGVFTLTFDKKTQEVYHRFFTIKTTSKMIDEFVTKKYYDVDFPELGSVKSKKKRQSDIEDQEYEMNRNDGSHVLGFSDKVVEVADPKNGAVLRGFCCKALMDSKQK